MLNEHLMLKCFVKKKIKEGMDGWMDDGFLNGESGALVVFCIYMGRVGVRSR